MNMRQNISSSVSKIIFWQIHNKGRMQFCRGILVRHHREKDLKRLNYHIEEWHTSTPYYILQNHSTYPTVCLLLDTWHRTYRCITVCGELIIYSNFKVTLPLTQVCLNFICCCNNTDEIKFIGVLHVIGEVPPEVVQKRLNMK